MSTDSDPILLGRIDGKLDMVLLRMDRQDADLRTLRQEVETWKEQIEDRITPLETFRSKIGTYATICTTAAVFVLTTLIEFTKSYIFK